MWNEVTKFVLSKLSIHLDPNNGTARPATLMQAMQATQGILYRKPCNTSGKAFKLLNSAPLPVGQRMAVLRLYISKHPETLITYWQFMK